MKLVSHDGDTAYTDPRDEASKVRDAFQTMQSLFVKYDIIQPSQAHRLIRERFTQEDLDLYRACLKLIDGSGWLG